MSEIRIETDMFQLAEDALGQEFEENDIKYEWFKIKNVTWTMPKGIQDGEVILDIKYSIKKRKWKNRTLR